MGEWLPIETAPKDGSAFQAVIPGHGSDNVIAWVYGYADDDGLDCSCWAFVADQEPPEDWSKGVCWASNEDGVPSTQPTLWKPLPEFEAPPRSQSESDPRKKVVRHG